MPKTPLHTLTALEQEIAAAQPRSVAKSRYVDGLDTRVLEWLIADSRQAHAASAMLAALEEMAEWSAGYDDMIAESVEATFRLKARAAIAQAKAAGL